MLLLPLLSFFVHFSTFVLGPRPSPRIFPKISGGDPSGSRREVQRLGPPFLRLIPPDVQIFTGADGGRMVLEKFWEGTELVGPESDRPSDHVDHFGILY